MIEATVRQYLEDTLNVPTYLEHEKTMPNEYIMVERTGGGMVNGLKNCTLAVQSISTSMYKAALLNEKVKDAMFVLPGEHNVSSSKLNSDYNFTDTTTKQYRYQAVFNLTHYE